MGLLDDAIREHLELKRRRGADPDEVARQEDEALGDPRTGEFARPAAAPAASDLADAPAEPGTPEEDTAEHEPAPERDPDVDPDPPAAYAASREPAPAERDEPWLDDDGIAPVTGQPTAEFTPPGVEPEPEAVPADDEPPADEDVLEETPEFLQETPEHDRLWFEQKPPRDFDFDR